MYWFYYPTHNTRIVEIGNARFNENGSLGPRRVEIQEVRMQIPLSVTSQVFVHGVVENLDNL